LHYGRPIHHAAYRTGIRHTADRIHYNANPADRLYIGFRSRSALHDGSFRLRHGSALGACRGIGALAALIVEMPGTAQRWGTPVLQ
jgi:hypothetical protein